MDDNTLVKKAYMENVAANSEWCKTIQILNCSQDLHSQEIPEGKFPKVAKQRIRDNFTQYWKTRISDQIREKKLNVYAQIKQHLQMEPYMSLPNFRDRQRITKFITSNHCLEIERGRHENCPRDQRLCKACASGVIEDEEHFLFECRTYDQTRLTHNLASLDQHCDNRLQQFFKMDPTAITQYLKAALDLRDKTVNFHVAQLSLCCMRMTLTRGRGIQNDKPATKLHATVDHHNKLTISRKRRRVTPYPMQRVAP